MDSGSGVRHFFRLDPAPNSLASGGFKKLIGVPQHIYTQST
jgi:hypothetical protein